MYWCKAWRKGVLCPLYGGFGKQGLSRIPFALSSRFCKMKERLVCGYYRAKATCIGIVPMKVSYGMKRRALPKYAACHASESPALQRKREIHQARDSERCPEYAG
jgi:hypothetical protein